MASPAEIALFSQVWQLALKSTGSVTIEWQVALHVVPFGTSHSSPCWRKPSLQTGATNWQLALQMPVTGGSHCSVPVTWPLPQMRWQFASQLAWFGSVASLPSQDSVAGSK